VSFSQVKKVFISFYKYFSIFRWWKCNKTTFTTNVLIMNL